MIILDLLATFQSDNTQSWVLCWSCSFIWGEKGVFGIQAHFLEEIEGYSIDFQYRDDPFYPNQLLNLVFRETCMWNIEFFRLLISFEIAFKCSRVRRQYLTWQIIQAISWDDSSGYSFSNVSRSFQARLALVNKKKYASVFTWEKSDLSKVSFIIIIIIIFYCL